MRLKSLRLAGFKSFANPTTFSFSKNITAIVGPNGCGKSNVIDAIRWVLGETSAKQLRGGAMSDVIFAGTQDKAAKSLASVELTFEHTQDEQNGIRHELNLYHELAVRRQVNKDGKSDYFINGTRCRRRDVVDIFLGTGLGSRSYAVIEQGMIGRIVDSSPLQLREFIEEAAGVSRYQARRAETQKKLTQAQENLDRLNDLRIELEKQQKTLERQAESAKSHKQLTEQLTKLEHDIAIHQLYAAKYSEQQQQNTHKSLKEESNNAQTALDEYKVKIDKLATRIAESQWLKDDVLDKHHQQQLVLQNSEHLLRQHEQNITLINEKLANCSETFKDNSAQLTQLDEKKALEQEQLNGIVPELDELQQQQKIINTQIEPLIKDWQNIHVEYDQLNSQHNELEKQLAVNEQAQKRLVKEQEKWTNRHHEWQQAWDAMNHNELNTCAENTAKNTTESTESRLTTIKAQLARVLRQQEDVSVDLEEKQQAFSGLKEYLQKGQIELQTTEKHLAGLNSEYNTLHALVHPPKKKTATTDTLNSTNHIHAELSALNVPAVSDKIELTTQGKTHAHILDTWLALWLDSLLVDADALTTNNSYTEPLLALLTQAQEIPTNKKDTSSTLSVLTTKKLLQAVSSVTHEKLIPLDKLIKAPQLALFENVFLLSDSSALTETDFNSIIEQLPVGCFVLTDTGYIIGNFGVIPLAKLANSSGDSHFLQQRELQRQRLSELEDALNTTEDTFEEQSKQVKHWQAQHDELNLLLEELKAHANNLQLSAHQHQQQITELTAALSRQQADTERLTASKKHLDAEQQALITENEQLTATLKTISSELPKVQEHLRRVSQQRQTIRSQRNDAENKNRALESSIQTLNMKKQQLTLTLNHINEQRTKLQEANTRNTIRQEELQADAEKLEQELPKIQQELTTQKNICYESNVQLEERQAQLSVQQKEYNTHNEQFQQQQIAFATLQQRVVETTTNLAIATERLNEACNRVDALNATSYAQEDEILEHDEATPNAESSEETKTQPRKKKQVVISSASLLTDFILHKGVDSFDVAKAETEQQHRQKEHQALQIRIGRMGAVNLVAVAELEQVKERLEPLTEQTDDILASINKLTDAITNIDNKTKELFLPTLASVNKDLVHLFVKVFGGGQASLTLVEDDKLDKKDTWRAGLELMAQPKGKKNSRLAVLSGGEKTLTALSLIFAIFKQHPAPFCVLDEVDAPLDDANVGRFTSLIEELASDLQFIFISHNKLSMQIADELKGITMPHAGISSLVSVNLDEAERYIEPQ